MFVQNGSMAGLQSYAVAVPTAGPYFVSGKVSLPTLSMGSTAASSVVVTVVNGTGSVTVYTGPVGAEGFYVVTPCAAGDVLTTTLSSAAAVDNVLNAVKAVVSVGSGI